MDLWTYSPEDVVILLGGVYQVKGLPEESFVRVKKVADAFSTKTAPDGTIARQYHRSAEYDVELQILSMSPSNDVLTKLWQLDEITRRAKFPILIKDNSGSGLFFSPTSWVQAPSSWDLGAGSATRSWAIKSTGGVINVGGNASPRDLLRDIANIVVGTLPGEDVF